MLPICENGFTWSICPFSGSLLKDPKIDESIKVDLPNKVKNALHLCYYPYSCKPYDTVFQNKITISRKNRFRLNLMHRILLLLGNKRFFISRIYSSFHSSLFKDTVEAFICISDIPMQKQHQGELCFQRSLLASKTSRSFQNGGVLFIGALLPTVKMHAWIIENGTQPDISDREWILYRPLLAFYYD